MELSRSERLQLAAIEERLERGDMGLAHSLRTMSPPRWRLTGRVVIAGVLLVFMLLTALTWAASGTGPQQPPRQDRTSVAQQRHDSPTGAGAYPYVNPWVTLGQETSQMYHSP